MPFVNCRGLYHIETLSKLYLPSRRRGKYNFDNVEMWYKPLLFTNGTILFIFHLLKKVKSSMERVLLRFQRRRRKGANKQCIWGLSFYGNFSRNQKDRLLESIFFISLTKEILFLLLYTNKELSSIITLFSKAVQTHLLTTKGFY